MRTAFGLTLDGPGERPVTVTAVTDPDVGWEPMGATRLVDLRTPDDAPYLHVDAGPAGYRLRAPDFGLHTVDPTGREIRTRTGDPDGERLLVAQTLPTAAALHGLDPLHASAVRTARGVLALSGPATSGKSTLKNRLVAAAAGTAFTDDVLAVELAGAEVLAHPGPDVAAAAAPVTAFVLLDRTAHPAAVQLVPADLPDLMGSAFVAHVTGAQRLQTHLGVCAALLEAGTAHRLVIGPGSGVDETLAVLLGLVG